MNYKKVVGIILFIFSVAGYFGYDYLQKEKTVVIYNQIPNSVNNSVNLTSYDLSLETAERPVKINLTLMNSNSDIYGTNVTQNISFFKGFNDEVIIRNILLYGNVEYGIYDKKTRMRRYIIDPEDVSFEKSYLNETGDIFIKTIGTSRLEKNFSVKVDISKLRKLAQYNNFTNAIFIVDYYPKLSMDVHIVDKNIKQQISSDIVYYFYIDLDKALGYE